MAKNQLLKELFWPTAIKIAVTIIIILFVFLFIFPIAFSCCGVIGSVSPLLYLLQIIVIFFMWPFALGNLLIPPPVLGEPDPAYAPMVRMVFFCNKPFLFLLVALFSSILVWENKKEGITKTIKRGSSLLIFGFLLMPEGNQMVAMLLLGMAIGSFIPRELPAPAAALNPYMPFLGFIFLVIAIVMFVKR